MNSNNQVPLIITIHIDTYQERSPSYMNILENVYYIASIFAIWYMFFKDNQ